MGAWRQGLQALFVASPVGLAGAVPADAAQGTESLQPLRIGFQKSAAKPVLPKQRGTSERRSRDLLQTEISVRNFS
jgi:hypothetical protein